MKTLLWAALVSIALLAASACGGKVIVVNGIRVYERYWEKTLRELRPRASFDFSCPQEQLRFTLFKRVRRAPTEVGVEGCGHRGMYVRAVSTGGIGPWVLNTEGGSVDPPVPPPPPSPPPVDPPPPTSSPPPVGQ